MPKQPHPAASGGNRLQPGNTCPHDEHARCGHRTGRRHHHRHGAIIDLRGIDHSLITSKIGLAGKHIHHLRARDARHELHGNRGQARLGHRRDIAFMAIRIHLRDHHGAAGIGLDIGSRRPANPQNDVSSGNQRSKVADNLGTLGFKSLVRQPRLQPGTGLDHHIEAQGLEALDRIRRCGNASFIGIALERNGNFDH